MGRIGDWPQAPQAPNRIFSGWHRGHAMPLPSTTRAGDHRRGVASVAARLAGVKETTTEPSVLRWPSGGCACSDLNDGRAKTSLWRSATRCVSRGVPKEDADSKGNDLWYAQRAG